MNMDKQTLKAKWQYWGDFDWWCHRYQALYWINPKFMRYKLGLMVYSRTHGAEPRDNGR